MNDAPDLIEPAIAGYQAEVHGLRAEIERLTRERDANLAAHSKMCNEVVRLRAALEQIPKQVYQGESDKIAREALK